jgi:hypothetical protein
MVTEMLLISLIELEKWNSVKRKKKSSIKQNDRTIFKNNIQLYSLIIHHSSHKTQQ